MAAGHVFRLLGCPRVPYISDCEKALAYAEMLVEDQDGPDLRQATFASVRRVDLREIPRAATVAVDSVSSPGDNVVIALMNKIMRFIDTSSSALLWGAL